MSKMDNYFSSKNSNFLQILPACGSNTYQIMYERLLTSNVSIRNGNIKYPIGKSIFAVNLPLKLSPAAVANADSGSPKSLHTLFDKYLDLTLAKFEQNCMVQTTRNFELFDKKPGFLKPFLTKC